MNSNNDCKNRREAIAALVLDELAPQAADELREHIDACKTCRSLYQALMDEEETINSAFEAIADKSKNVQDDLIGEFEKGPHKPLGRSTLTLSTILNSRITKLAAAAVVVIVAVVALHNGSVQITTPAFGVQDVLDAMNEAQWVHCVGEITYLNVDANTAKEMDLSGVESWESVRPVRRIEKHKNGKIYFTESNIGKTSYYDPATNKITIKYRSPADPQEAYASIADMYIQQIAELEKKGAKINYEDGVYDGVSVKIMKIDFVLTPPLEVNISMVLDPATYLPKRLTAEQTDLKRLHVLVSAQFDYPKTGPRDIYEAGAPADAKVIIVDNRPSPEFLEAIAPYNAARENLPLRHILVFTQAREKSVWRTCVIYKDGRRERLEDRWDADERQESVPTAEDFEAILAWALSVGAKTLKIQIYDGQYIHYARRDLEGMWSVAEKEHSPEKMSHSIIRGLDWLGWPWIYNGKLFENDYSQENNLVCVETHVAARIKDGKLIAAAYRELYYLDPQHEYVCVREERFQRSQPPYNDRPDVKDLDFDPDDIPSEPSYVATVAELAQTDSGRWYPKKIRKDRHLWRASGNGCMSHVSTEFTAIYLQTNPWFPEGIFDPNNLLPEGAQIREPGAKTTFEKDFEAAIAIIDGKDQWSTPEEVALAYWQARARKDCNEMAVLWPGSASWNRQLVENETPVEYVFGKARKAGGKYVIVPYTDKSYYEKHGDYNLKTWLTNEKSTKGRYYIISGN
ncbi:MAG TPA: zf-HC2 domain-containing protein [Sedimentisphaerales bacterium]|nr:zf-HC2 domain-containing protein [Sedimentisphaerales bacterium]